MATQEDCDRPPDWTDANLCWREWNSYSDCHEIEQAKRDAAAELYNALRTALFVRGTSNSSEVITQMMQDALDKAQVDYTL